MPGNRVLADIIRRGGGRLLNVAVAKALPDEADEKPRRRTLLGPIAGAAVVRIATRSIPGAIAVGGGILAKRLYDKRRAKRDKS